VTRLSDTLPTFSSCYKVSHPGLHHTFSFTIFKWCSMIKCGLILPFPLTDTFETPTHLADIVIVLHASSCTNPFILFCTCHLLFRPAPPQPKSNYFHHCFNPIKHCKPFSLLSCPSARVVPSWPLLHPLNCVGLLATLHASLPIMQLLLCNHDLSCWPINLCNY
jgi:hypothetical protein